MNRASVVNRLSWVVLGFVSWAWLAWPIAVVPHAPAQAQAQTAGESRDPARLTVDRIFDSGDFRAEEPSGLRWLNQRGGYTTKEASEKVKGAHDLVRTDLAGRA